MYFFEELNELKKMIMPCLLVFFCFSIFFFIFPFTQPLSAWCLEITKQNLLPSAVQLITTNPLNAFLAQMMVSFLLALVLGLPFYLYKIIKYLTPAFSEKETGLMLKVLTPCLGLFLAGCLFSYFFLIPSTFKILYSYAVKIGAATFFTVNDFVIVVLILTLAGGIIFLLPVSMVLLSRLGLVGPAFWKKKWRNAILMCLIFSAIITPDGTGITMLILSLPITGLYFLGCILTKNY